MEDQDRKYFLPGEYIGDMHEGRGNLSKKIRERVGDDRYIEYTQTQFPVLSVEQATALTDFLEATRALSGKDRYLNKMVVAVDDHTGAYMYDGQYFGLITF